MKTNQNHSLSPLNYPLEIALRERHVYVTVPQLGVAVAVADLLSGPPPAEAIGKSVLRAWAMAREEISRAIRAGEPVPRPYHRKKRRKPNAA